MKSYNSTADRTILLKDPDQDFRWCCLPYNFSKKQTLGILSNVQRAHKVRRVKELREFSVLIIYNNKYHTNRFIHTVLDCIRNTREHTLELVLTSYQRSVHEIAKIER